MEEDLLPVIDEPQGAIDQPAESVEPVEFVEPEPAPKKAKRKKGKSYRLNPEKYKEGQKRVLRWLDEERMVFYGFSTDTATEVPAYETMPDGLAEYLADGRLIEA